ncbi:MAG TPA: phosphoribosylamine--glycine ligase, partial [Spirochaetota bacterium]|nr:phosphoribosylamine--glycine ligase [Spirochaetota bacterium]
DICERFAIPTAAWAKFSGIPAAKDYVRQQGAPIVIKADGLAAGKGVIVAMTLEEALEAIDTLLAEGGDVVIEEFMDGEEASFFALSDGTNILALATAQDHKRAFDGDKGPNTGGMGAYAPAPVMTGALLEKVRETVLQPTIDGMRAEGIPFKGILYAGLIISGGSINVLEYNVRFGDPEAQVILPLLEGKLGDYIQASVAGRLGGMKLSFKKEHAITVVMASGGYPGSYPKGKVITGLDRAGDDIIVFHAGTRREGDNVLTSGGRVLNVTALGATLEEARQKVYDSISSISFEGGFYRKDIAYRALGR